jgi:hypothetical protein
MHARGGRLRIDRIGRVAFVQIGNDVRRIDDDDVAVYQHRHLDAAVGGFERTVVRLQESVDRFVA